MTWYEMLRARGRTEEGTTRLNKDSSKGVICNRVYEIASDAEVFRGSDGLRAAAMIALPGFHDMQE